MPAPTPPAAVLFDNDGVTLDSEQCWTRAEVVLFGRRGLDFTHAHKVEIVGSSAPVARAILERQLGEPGNGDALMAELHDLVWEEMGRAVEPMPGAVALLDALAAAGIPVGLASNSPRALVERALATAGLAGRFARMLGGDEVAHAKPAPDLYLQLAAALGVDPAGCVALEDSPPGAAAARAAGAFVVGVPSLPGVTLDVDLLATSLLDPAVHARLGL